VTGLSAQSSLGADRWAPDLQTRRPEFQSSRSDGVRLTIVQTQPFGNWGAQPNHMSPEHLRYACCTCPRRSRDVLRKYRQSLQLPRHSNLTAPTNGEAGRRRHPEGWLSISVSAFRSVATTFRSTVEPSSIPENGVLGMGPAAGRRTKSSPADQSALHHAARGGSICHHADSFSMIRGGP